MARVSDDSAPSGSRRFRAASAWAKLLSPSLLATRRLQDQIVASLCRCACKQTRKPCACFHILFFVPQLLLLGSDIRHQGVETVARRRQKLQRLLRMLHGETRP
jgi:hypothetical protein